jgi:hypothetical protein
MATVDLVPDQLWNAIQPLLPPEPPKPRGGRPRVPDRAVLGGIVFMLAPTASVGPNKGSAQRLLSCKPPGPPRAG